MYYISKPEEFKTGNVSYVCSIMNKKTSKKSQYYRETFSGEITHHSQLGTGYDLAKLGSYKEVMDRLRKYDREYPPLTQVAVDKTFEHFFRYIGRCSILDRVDAFGMLNKDASVGFGGKSMGIIDRKDPSLFDYLEQYLELASFCIINGSQKDEIRVIDKTPRLYTSYPVEHTFLATMLLYHFCQQFYANSFIKKGVSSAVSDSPQKGAFKVYLDQLTMRKYLYATDTSAQDSSISPVFISQVYKRIANNMELDETTTLWLNRIEFNSINKLISINGNCYLVSGGLGSGDYLTLVINILWRMYMVLENYKYDLDKFFEHNTVVINGDDLAMSSDYVLDLSSRHAQIEWKGSPISVKELDFCSMRFSPYIHHDEDKCRAVLTKRKKKQFVGMDSMEMQRLGGMLQLCVSPGFHQEVLERMKSLASKNSEMEKLYWQLWVSWDEVFYNYNQTDYNANLINC